jgi:hypothetical protein
MKVFVLQRDRYVEENLTDPKIWMPEIDLGIGLWKGEYKGINRLWLRFYDANGNWILTEAEQAKQRTEYLEQRLRELGIEP